MLKEGGIDMVKRYDEMQTARLKAEYALLQRGA